MGPKTDPCGTSHIINAGDEADDPVRRPTYWCRPTRYVSNHCSTILDSPYEVFSHQIKKLCPPCRKLRTNPATSVQMCYWRQWRAECLTKLSTLRFQLNGQRDMWTGAVSAGRTYPDIPVARSHCKFLPRVTMHISHIRFPQYLSLL